MDKTVLSFRQWKISTHEIYGPYAIRTPFGSRRYTVRPFDWQAFRDYCSHINPGMGFANINYRKANEFDMDFTGELRVPIEYGGQLFRIGVFVKRTPEKKQYLSIKILDHESVKESGMPKRIEGIVNRMVERGNLGLLSGGVAPDPIEIEGYDDVNDEF